jgi:hypothetical protein
MKIVVSVEPSDIRVTKPAPTLPALEHSRVANATSMTATMATRKFMVNMSHCCAMTNRYEGRCELRHYYEPAVAETSQRHGF